MDQDRLDLALYEPASWRITSNVRAPEHLRVTFTAASAD